MIEILQRFLPLKVTIKFHNHDTSQGDRVNVFSHFLSFPAFSGCSSFHCFTQTEAAGSDSTVGHSLHHTHTHTHTHLLQTAASLHTTTAMTTIQQAAAGYRLTLMEIMTLYGTVSNTVINGVFALIMQYAPLLHCCRPQSMADLSYSQLTRTDRWCYPFKRECNRQHVANVEYSVLVTRILHPGLEDKYYMNLA